MDHPTREQAIKAIHDLFDHAFGHDKGSDEMYIDWCDSHGLVVFEDDGGEPIASDWPGELQFLAALGVTEQEMVDVLHINPKVFGP